MDLVTGDRSQDSRHQGIDRERGVAEREREGGGGRWRE